MDAAIRDLKQSCRMFVRNPAFALAAVAALTLGIGANTAIFSVVNAVLLKPVAVPDSEHVVMFVNVSPNGSGPAASPAKFAHYQRQTEVVQDVSAFNTGVVNFTGGTFPEQLRSGRVSADFLKLVGAPVLLGRTFSAEDDVPRGPRVVVIDRHLWESRFNADVHVVGRALSLGGEPYTIIGVLNAFDFREFGPTPQVWLLFQFDPNTTDQGHYFQAFGRLKPGVTVQQADARMQASAKDYRSRFPNALGPKNTFGVKTIRDVIVRDDVKSSLLIYGGAVSLVLLIACANVANLLLVRATGRRREIAIRSAIGGSRARIMRQLLTESVVLSLTGGVCGLFVGWAGIRALLSINTANLPRVGEHGDLVAIDWRVVGFTVLASLITGVIFGLIPALHASKTDLTTTLKESSGRSGTGFKQNKMRAVLVVVEVALALVLLIGSALLIRTAAALGRVDPGFDAHNVITMRMSMKGAQYEKAEAVEQVIRSGVEKLRSIPGVVNASATCCVPLEGGYGLPFRIAGRPLDANSQGPFHGGGGWTTISPGYFEVFKIPITRGRTINDRDTSASTPVVVINEAMAKQYWPSSDPLNDRLVIGKGVMREFETEGERQIVGVVANIHSNGLDSEPQPQMFIPQAQVPDAANALNVGLTPVAWIVRTQQSSQAMTNAVQEQLRQSTGLPVTDVQSMDTVVSVSVSRQRFNMWVMTVFGACALLLAAIGIYGLMAYSVEQRTQEIGIRLALGAQAAQVRTMVVLQGMALALIGVAIGLGASFWMARLITTFLFGVAARDPVVFAGVPALLTIVALCAVVLPAQRASGVDPIIALRTE
jgi:putative ABC transport system permease protein